MAALSTIEEKAIDSIQRKETQPAWRKKFPVLGKGTFLFNIERCTPFYITVRGGSPDTDLESWIGLTVTEDRVSFLDKILDGRPQLLCEATSSELFGSNIGIEPGNICTYWLSYDRDRMVIKYGKGYRMEQTTILEYDFGNLEKKKRDVVRNVFFDPKVDRYVELYDDQTDPELTPAGDNLIHYTTPSTSELPGCSIFNVENQVDFEPLPLVSDLSYLVKDSATCNLFDLDSGKYVYSTSLPGECQTLYNNVTAANIDLDYQGTDPKNHYDFMLSEAIRYSIETDGCVLNEKLKEKAKEFGKPNPHETYLRITLGKDRGNSPGIPYVLEIWPKGNGSPIHNHGRSYAVIRVIHGGLTISYYNKQSEKVSVDPSVPCDDNQATPDCGPQQLGKFNVKKGDVTWISPNWYQTHKLWNNTNDYCVTVQCYKYGKNDDINWPYFDYLKSTDIIGEFTPDSDFSFTEMYNRVMKEYADRSLIN